MCAVMLSKIAGTKYFIDANESSYGVFSKAIETCRLEHRGEDIDLAGCRFGPIASRALLQATSSCNFVNTEDDRLDAILRHNKQACTAKHIETIPLRFKFNDWKEVLEYVHEVAASGKAYRIEYCDIAAIDIAILILGYAPAVMLDLGSRIEDVFERVRATWIPNRKTQHDRYWLVRGNYASIVERGSDGMFSIPLGGKYSESKLIENYCCLPEEFGTVNLKNNAEYTEVMHTALTALLTKPKDVRRIKDILCRRDTDD